MSETKTVAYSYIRFSTPSQAKGDSLRRQTEAAADWCRRHGVVLDESTTLHDLGTSAFTGSHRTNPDRKALAAFLKMVERSAVPRGSYLIIENLDRLSREHIRPALTLLLNLIEAGIRVVQLKPVETVYDESVDPMMLMMAIMELSRGHSESAMKSQRVGAAWKAKKAKAREGVILTNRLPAWVRREGDRLELIPERAAVVRRIFELCVAGHGITSVVTRLTRDGVETFVPGRRWTRTYVRLILKDRRPVGELQPRRRGTKDGEPIVNYYPAVVTEREWLAARAAAAQRRRHKGRVSTERVNIFAGILKHARDDDSIIMTPRVSYTAGRLVRRFQILTNSRQQTGLATAYSIPYDAFEGAILSQLAELNPRDVFPTVDDPSGEVRHLEEEQAALEADLQALAIRLDQKVTDALIAAAERKEDRLAEVRRLLAAARAEAGNPPAAAWDNMRSLAAALDQAPDPQDVRLAIRAALRRTVAEMRLLLVPLSKRVRIAAVTIYFASGQRRDYLISHRSAKRPFGRTEQPERTEVRSVAGFPGALDLRNPDHAERLAEALAAAGGEIEAIQ